MNRGWFNGHTTSTYLNKEYKHENDSSYSSDIEEDGWYEPSNVPTPVLCLPLFL